MLMVNADDWGRSRLATDRAHTCHAAGRITSASAMVFMKDSSRAAAMALDCGIDVGLHINLSEPFTSDAVPVSLRADHDRLCRFLGSSKYALLLFNPLLTHQFKRVVQAQSEEFIRLYKRAPVRVDGHLHMHLASNVIIQRLVPAGTIVRRNFSFRPGEKSLLNRLYRRVIDAHLSRRHRTTDYFFSLANHLSAERLRHVVGLSAAARVELMVHPELSDEYEFLMSDEYRQVMTTTTLSVPPLLHGSRVAGSSVN
jgi:chitin disaccharide deacetylase